MSEETKRCQFCGEEILAIATKCKHCGSGLTESEPSGPSSAKPAADYGLGLIIIPVVSTVLIWFWVGSMNLLQSPGSTLTLIMVATVLGTAIIAAMEASKVGMVSDRKKGAYSPTAWFFILTLLWVIGYPFYLAKRRYYGLANRVVPGILVAILFFGSGIIMTATIEARKAEIRADLGQLQGGLDQLGNSFASLGFQLANAYQGDKIRSRVSDATLLASAARTAVDVAYSELGRLDQIPTDHAELGLEPPDAYRTKYVKSVSVDKQGIVTVALSADPRLGDAKNGVIKYVPKAEGSYLLWSPKCSFDPRWCPKR